MLTNTWAVTGVESLIFLLAVRPFPRRAVTNVAVCAPCSSTAACASSVAASLSCKQSNVILLQQLFPFQKDNEDNAQKYTYSHFQMSAVVVVVKSVLLKLSTAFQPRNNKHWAFNKVDKI